MKVTNKRQGFANEFATFKGMPELGQFDSVVAFFVGHLSQNPHPNAGRILPYRIGLVPGSSQVASQSEGGSRIAATSIMSAIAFSRYLRARGDKKKRRPCRLRKGVSFFFCDQGPQTESPFFGAALISTAKLFSQPYHITSLAEPVRDHSRSPGAVITCGRCGIGIERRRSHRFQSNS